MGRIARGLVGGGFGWGRWREYFHKDEISVWCAWLGNVGFEWDVTEMGSGGQGFGGIRGGKWAARLRADMEIWR